LQYTVKVRTGDRLNAGTNANVFLTLLGSGTTKMPELQIDHAHHDDFER
jgi:hypothetical protein